MEEEGKKLLLSLLESLLTGDSEKINKLKYDNLFYGSNLLDVVINYIFLSHHGIVFDFGYQIIKKGTKLYRIRKLENGVDFSDPSQWTYPPLMPENRANHYSEPALYLGTTEIVCLLETHIHKEEKYMLGEYTVTEDIKLGGFLNCEDYKKYYWYIAGVILNAFLIAPSREEKNIDVFDFLDYLYKNISVEDLKIGEEKNLDLPFKFGVINKKDNFYKVTNILIETIKEKNPEGICYSSCYLPLATIGIVCSDYNIVLYKSGMNKISFMKSETKINTKEFSALDVIKVLLDSMKKK